MYKVFFKDRIVFLTNNIERDLNSDFGAIFKYSNPKELHDFISNFENKDEIKMAYIYHHNLTELVSTFESCFKLIKAAGGVVFNEKNEILFIKRLGFWDLPKGKIESGESIQETAVREVEEECGISPLQIDFQLKETYHTYYLKENLILKKTYWYKMSYIGNQKLIPQTEEDITEVKWLNTDNLSLVKSNTYPGILEILKELNL